MLKQFNEYPHEGACAHAWAFVIIVHVKACTYVTERCAAVAAV
jgi:hypothetical protein